MGRGPTCFDSFHQQCTHIRWISVEDSITYSIESQLEYSKEGGWKKPSILDWPHHKWHPSWFNQNNNIKLKTTERVYLFGSDRGFSNGLMFWSRFNEMNTHQWRSGSVHFWLSRKVSISSCLRSQNGLLHPRQEGSLRQTRWTWERIKYHTYIHTHTLIHSCSFGGVSHSTIHMAVL